MTRKQLIDSGKVWIVYKDKVPDIILFEGTRNKCLQHINFVFGLRAYMKGQIRLGKVIYEPETVSEYL